MYEKASVRSESLQHPRRDSQSNYEFRQCTLAQAQAARVVCMKSAKYTSLYGNESNNTRNTEDKKINKKIPKK